ncbi:MAG: hypothetical protein WCS56_00150 [Bacilli bacterium]
MDSTDSINKDNMSSVLKITLPLLDIDMISVNTFKDFCFGESDILDLRHDYCDFPLLLVDMLQAAIARVGGYAFIEGCTECVTCWWSIPKVEVGYPTTKSLEVMYVSHMLQVGLLSKPDKIISDLAYTGYGFELANLLVLLSACNLNKYIARRDLYILAGAMINSSIVWFSLGLLLFADGDYKACKPVFERILVLEPSHIQSLKYMSILNTLENPQLSLEFAERMFNFASSDGIVDHNIRATYAFALMAANNGDMVDEAKDLFYLICEVEEPKMTLLQWFKWGHKIPIMMLPHSLLDPIDPVD